MHVHIQGNIFQSPLTGQVTLTNTSSVKQAAILGVRELSWNLLETEGHQDRGRYLEELVFSLEESPELSEPEIRYTWRMGYTAPKLTTYPSNVQYSLIAAALVAPKEALLVRHLQAWYIYHISCVKIHILIILLDFSPHVNTLQQSSTLTANGTVCMDNKDLFVFHCSSLGLKSKTTDSVNIQATLPYSTA